MKIEYLLVKTKDDFCASIEQFKNLLLSNNRITMDEEHITVSKVCFNYTLSMVEVNWKTNKEIVFSFTISIDDQEHVEAIESIDALIRRINEVYGYPFAINTIWDDVSIYYTNKLYPRMVEIENIVRNVIYRFMIKTAGSSWFSSASPDDFKDAINKNAERNQLDSPTEDQLYLADFIQLGWFFFAKYPMKQLGPNAIEELKKILDEKDEKVRNKKINDFLLSYEYKCC